METNKPLVIAHRGASGYLPEHTLAAYSLAILQGADYIEPDLVMTRDGHLIARHDNQLDLTTDVAKHPEFVNYRSTKVIDGKTVTGWFSEDFSLKEIKQLRTIERIPDVRPANQRFDGDFDVPTFAEILALVKALEPVVKRRIGIYPETKHPSHFQKHNLAMEALLVKQLSEAGYTKKSDPVFIQSFEVENLKTLNALTDLRLTQLIWVTGGPADDSQQTYAHMLEKEGLVAIAKYADAIGVELFHSIAVTDNNGRLMVENEHQIIRNAHALDLEVHGFTLRAENAFLPKAYQSSQHDHEYGDLAAAAAFFTELGIDALFSDHPDQIVR